MNEFLILSDKEDCISCTEATVYVTKCCKAHICPDCYMKWLEHKRQCMHCNRDQIDFDTWVKDYKIDEEEEEANIGNLFGLVDTFLNIAMGNLPIVYNIEENINWNVLRNARNINLW